MRQEVRKAKLNFENGVYEVPTQQYSDSHTATGHLFRIENCHKNYYGNNLVNDIAICNIWDRVRMNAQE